MEEIWAACHCHYEVSTIGRVRSIDRVISNRNYKGKILRSTGGGYKGRYLKVNIAGTTTLVHRLVATAFVPNVDELETVDHIDGDQRNNIVSNLRWCSGPANTAYHNLSQTHKRGVSKTGKRWRMDCYLPDSTRVYEYYTTEVEAYEAYYTVFLNAHGQEPFKKEFIYD